MKMSQNQNEPSNLTFEQSVPYLKDFIGKMRDGNREARKVLDEVVAEASAQNDSKRHTVTYAIITSLQNGEALYLIADYLLNVLKAQDQVNRELLGHINKLSGSRVDLTPETVGAMTKSILNDLKAELDRKARNLHESLYG
jgi:hypothetical protein